MVLGHCQLCSVVFSKQWWFWLVFEVGVGLPLLLVFRLRERPLLLLRQRSLFVQMLSFVPYAHAVHRGEKNNNKQRYDTLCRPSLRPSVQGTRAEDPPFRVRGIVHDGLAELVPVPVPAALITEHGCRDRK